MNFPFMLLASERQVRTAKLKKNKNQKNSITNSWGRSWFNLQCSKEMGWKKSKYFTC